MHATLVEGTPADQQTFLEQEFDRLGITHYDRTVLTTEDNSIGIAEIRSFVQSLGFKPQGRLRAGVISAAEKLTIEAQNALLKTLEEPPSQTILYLLTENISALLPTIISRCNKTTIFVTRQLEKDITAVITNYYHESNIQKLIIHDTWIINKKTALEWTNNLLLYEAIQPDRLDSINKTNRVRKLFTVQQKIESNVTPKSVFDTFVLED